MKNGFQKGPENQPNSNAKFQQQNTSKNGRKSEGTFSVPARYDTKRCTVGEEGGVQNSEEDLKRTSEEKKSTKETGSHSRV